MTVLGTFFTRGVSLRKWEESGLFDREVLVYHAHLESGYFSQIYWFTYGAADADVAQVLHDTGRLSRSITVVPCPRWLRLAGRARSALYSLLLPVFVRKIVSGADAVLDLLLDLVGASGTLVMMAATTSFASTQRFDLLNSPSETGTLTEVMRRRRPAARSFVPMTSFVASGAREAGYLEKFDSYLDRTSPFSRLLEYSGKVLLLGVGFDRCTLYHLAEERFQVPYNTFKTFHGTGIDANSVAGPISQTYFVRKDLGLVKDSDRVSRSFAEDNIRCFSADFGLRRIHAFKAAVYDEFMSSRLADDNLCLIRSE